MGRQLAALRMGSLRRYLTTELLTALALGLAGFAIAVVGMKGHAITWDEVTSFDTVNRYGQWFRQLAADTLKGRPFDAFRDEVIVEHWQNIDHHPPFARILLGVPNLANVALGSPVGYDVACRAGVCIFFAVFIALFYLFVHEHYGKTIALFSGLALLGMPRFFPFTHISTPDLPITVMCFLTTFCFVKGLRSWKWAIATGVVYGFTIGTKLNSFFVPFVLVPWALLLRFGGAESEPKEPARPTGLGLQWPCWRRVLPNFIAMAVLAPISFLACWPWLWRQTYHRFWNDYMAFHRTHFYPRVWYLGQQYQEPPAPWHYPFVEFVFTTPAVILLAIVVGVLCLLRWREKRAITALVLGSAALPMLVLTMPSVPKYNGTRLFLVSFPYLAICGGAGLAWCFHCLSSLAPRSITERKRKACVAVALTAVCLVPTILSYPFPLSYYSELIGGRKGALRIGLDSAELHEGIHQDLYDFLGRTVKPDEKVFFFPVNETIIRNCQRKLGYLKLREDQARAEEIKGADNSGGDWDWRDVFNDYDYYVMNCRQGKFDATAWSLYHRGKHCFEISHGGVPLSRVYRTAENLEYLCSGQQSNTGSECQCQK